MYNRHLDTFIQVADCGSFMKAADKLFISATAVTKQINLLEQHLDIKLFERNSQGVTLTEAGKVIYNDAKKIIQYSNNSIKKAKELDTPQQTTIRIGVSLMNQVELLMDYWAILSGLHPEFHLEIVTYEDTYDSFQNVLKTLGQKIDIIACPICEGTWSDYCSVLRLQDTSICVAVPKKHRLSGHSKLRIQDLYGEDLIVIGHEYGDTMGDMKAMLNDLERQHPLINLIPKNYLNYSIFNHAVSSNQIIISLECWTNVHSFLRNIPVDWDYRVPYGLLYSKNPSDDVLHFITVLNNNLLKKPSE